MNVRALWEDVAQARTGRLKAWMADATSQVGRHFARTRLRSRWLSEQWHFYHAWRANPRGIGAILPSGRALAAAITREIGPSTGPVLELGVGTGAFTRGLLRRGVLSCDMVLVERDPGLAASLRREFPGAQVLGLDAAGLDRHVLFPGGAAGAAVCGLPLLNMPLRTRLRILRSTFAHLRSDGACYLFTYGVHCPVPRRLLERMGLRARRLAKVYANVPPAQVWKLTRRTAACGRRPTV